MKLKHTLTLLAMLIGVFCSYGQSTNSTYSIIFSFDSDKIDLGIADNRKTINDLLDNMDEIHRDTTKVVTKIVIDSYTSPEGGVTYNKDLSLRRSNSLYDYLSTRTPFKRNLYDIKGTGINWELLIQMVENSDMDYKGEVLNILRYTPEETWTKSPTQRYKALTDSRNKQLMDLKGGVPYNYMKDNFFPRLRVGSALSLYYEPKYPEADTVFVDKVDTVYQSKTEYIKVVEPIETTKSLLLALKTNLLSDALLIPSIEVEVPIGDRFSANAEFSCLWISDDMLSNHWSHEFLSYGVEGRYWFGDRSKRSQLTGLFGGVYFSRAKFDIQRKENQGNQIDIDYSIGVSGGYTLPLSDHFNMEFSAAVGYVNGTSNKYDVNENGYLVRRGEMENISTIFPTKAKVSLVWLINTTKTK